MKTKKASTASAGVGLLCVYSCPCGSNDRGGSNYPEGICSRAADTEAALNALKIVYRKHHKGDERIGWQEMDEHVLGALLKLMGTDGYMKWANSLDT
jgi:hypothetical protein